MKRVRFADALDEEGRHVLPKTRRPRTLLPGPEQGDGHQSKKLRIKHVLWCPSGPVAYICDTIVISPPPCVSADNDNLEGELTEGYRGAADIEDLLHDGEPQGDHENEPCFYACLDLQGSLLCSVQLVFAILSCVDIIICAQVR